MGWLHSNSHIDILCQHRYLQTSSLEHELKYEISAKSKESTVIQTKVIRIAQLKLFRTLTIGLTGIGTWILQISAIMMMRWTVNLIKSKTIASRIQNSQISAIQAPCQLVPDPFGQHVSQRDSL